MSGPPDPREQSEVRSVVEPRQRWRLVVSRSDAAPSQTQRDLADAWTSGLEAAGLPLAPTDGGRNRARIAFGAPLPVGMAAEHELIDIVLVERWPAWRVREALAHHVPDGWQVIKLYDVWLAGPPLAGRVSAADYRIELGAGVDTRLVGDAASAMLAADRLPRERAKGGGTVPYDLRPLLIDLSLEVGPPAVVRTRTRFHPELGTGRPEEVLAALTDRLGTPLEARSIVRERVLLAEELG